MAESTIAYIGLGSNLGDRSDFIQKALKILGESKDIEVLRVSDIIETKPLTGSNQLQYLNAVTEIKTSLSADELHKRVLNIEILLGRVRQIKWSPRTIDLDILLFGQEVINRHGLIVPHSQLHLRSFALTGLCQLNGEIIHPVLKQSIKELTARLAGQDFFLNPDRPQLIGISGVIGVGKTTLATKLSTILGAKLLLEPYDENPYLPQVYAGDKELALDSQLFFLTRRAKQLSADFLTPGKIAISDYIFDKELIYAKRLLSDKQLALYNEIYPAFAAKVAPPALVIHLKDSVQNCLERIKKRGRPYEQQIEPRFLETLDSDFERLFAGWKTCPLINISMSQWDNTDDAKVRCLAAEVKSYIAVKENGNS